MACVLSLAVPGCDSGELVYQSELSAIYLDGNIVMANLRACPVSCVVHCVFGLSQSSQFIS